MELEILGAHNCESESARLTCLLVDRVLAIDAGGLTSALSIEEQHHLKAVLITHHHFDHIRDLATLGMNFWTAGPLPVYGLDSTLQTVSNHILNGVLYPDFTSRPSTEKPAFKLHPIAPGKTFAVGGYSILPFLANHNVPTVGYQITGADKKSFAYTGDTYRLPEAAWQGLSPRLVVTEVTMSDKYESAARESKHLTPRLLKEELQAFKRTHKYIPPVIAVHISPHLEDDIRKEISRVAEELGTEITCGYEGMRVVI
jgi:phosphoribosyl 1,2-cyclic phosphodiesterase